MQVLPDPDSDTLTSCDDNSATRVLAAAIYCQSEQHYFDETRSRVDIATLSLQYVTIIEGCHGRRLQVRPPLLQTKENEQADCREL